MASGEMTEQEFVDFLGVFLKVMVKNTSANSENTAARANVWDYAGVNTFRAERDADLAMNPTVNPSHSLPMHSGCDANTM